MLKKLNTDRRVDPGSKWSPVFGRYSFVHPHSDGHVINVGDDVVVSRRNAEKTRFGKCILFSILASLLVLINCRSDWEGLCTK